MVSCAPSLDVDTYFDEYASSASVHVIPWKDSKEALKDVSVGVELGDASSRLRLLDHNIMQCNF
eukprot:scaffold101000_cov19-Tisochrysis_lutea.AAC.2